MQWGTVSTTIEQYREAKNTYLKLQAQAKKDLLARFHQLEEELLQVQRELREDFAVKVAIRTKPKGGRVKQPLTSATKEPAKSHESSPETLAIEKKLALQKRKLEEISKAGKPDKLIRDRIYELEDELRLAKEK